MKQLITFFLMMLPYLAFAQDSYISLLNDTKVWTIKYESISWPVGKTSYTETVLRGDTIIDGVKFMKMWYRNWGEGEEKQDEWDTRNLFLGQDGGKVFIHHAGIKKPYTELILDFSVETGNVIKVRDAYEEECVSYLVTAVTDTILLNSDDMSKRRCIHLRGEWYNITDVWIEGIGSLAYGIEGDMSQWGGSRTELIKCTEGDVILYQREDKDLSIIRHLYSPSVQPQFFDLQGRRLAAPPVKGVYIRDGKKVVR